ncbi:MAG: hypothetical protein EZS28_005394 [Streblomastix strix]|uniref:Uncharacterized protein n=1 Tax=Streblomastix strix TaxID=222440 RepID=A0A5J4WVS8_9EUKA|nr:MAG: hypothetical protein EZS28_005394 [Streblomastix strix]
MCEDPYLRMFILRHTLWNAILHKHMAYKDFARLDAKRQGIITNKRNTPTGTNNNENLSDDEYEEDEDEDEDYEDASNVFPSISPSLPKWWLNHPVWKRLVEEIAKILHVRRIYTNPF